MWSGRRSPPPIRGSWSRPRSRWLKPGRGGDVVGLFETLAGVPTGRRQRIVHRTQALWIEREDFFDLMGQYPALPQRLLGALFSELSEAPRAPNSSGVADKAAAVS